MKIEQIMQRALKRRTFVFLLGFVFLLSPGIWAGADPISRARRLRAEGKTEEALEVLKASSQEGVAETADLLLEQGDLLRELGRAEEALDLYNRVIKLRPPVSLLTKALERKYRLGLDFLEGNAKRSFLGLFSYSSPSFGVRILDELVHEFPYESFSDDALYSIANYYFRKGEWSEAQAVYERLIDTYPRSEWVPPSYFQLGKSIYMQIKGYRYDPTPIAKARWYFERFLEKRRVGPEAEEARRFVRKLKDMEAKYELYVASFYLLNDCPVGAKLHLRAAVKKGRLLGGELTQSAKEAQAKLMELAAKEEKKK